MSGWNKEDFRQSVFLCVDTFEKGVPTGRLYRLCQEREERFDSLLHCLQKIQAALDTEQIPPTGGAEQARPKWKRGGAATFEVQVLFCRNDSWQGFVTWVEGDRKEAFGSVWDLIQKMDHMLCEALSGVFSSCKEDSTDLR